MTASIPSTPSNGAGRVVAVVAELVRHVVIDPVTGGRIRRRGWPSGLAVPVVIGLAIYLASAVVAVFGASLRAGLTPGTSALGVSPVVLPVAAFVVTLVVALLTTAGIHAPWPLRIAGLAAPAVLWLSIANYANRPVWLVVPLLAWLSLVGLTAARARRPYVWWEFPAVVAVVGAVTVWLSRVVTAESLRIGAVDAGLQVVLLVMSVGIFAIAFTITAGAALTEVALITALWTVELVGREVGDARLRVTVLVGLGLALGLTAMVWSWSVVPPIPHLTSLLAALVVLGVTYGCWVLADRSFDAAAASPRWGPFVTDTGPEHLLPTFRAVGVWIAIAASAPYLVNWIWVRTEFGLQATLQSVGVDYAPQSLGQRLGLQAWFASPVSGGLWPAVAVCVVLAIGFWRRRHRGAAELVVLILVLTLVRALAGSGVWFAAVSLLDLSLAVLLVVAVVALRWWATGRLVGSRIEAVGIAVMLAVAIATRELLADPVGWVFSTVGGGLVILGLAWTLLTDADLANGDSRRFPRPARVLAMISYLATAALIAAFDALAADFQIDLEQYVRFGGDVFGSALLIAGIWSVLTADRRRASFVTAPPTPTQYAPGQRAPGPSTWQG